MEKNVQILAYIVGNTGFESRYPRSLKCYLIQFHRNHGASKPPSLPATLAVHVLVCDKGHVLSMLRWVALELFQRRTTLLLFQLDLLLQILLAPIYDKNPYWVKGRSALNANLLWFTDLIDALLCLPVLVSFLNLQYVSFPLGAVEQSHTLGPILAGCIQCNVSEPTAKTVHILGQVHILECSKGFEPPFHVS